MLPLHRVSFDPILACPATYKELARPALEHALVAFRHLARLGSERDFEPGLLEDGEGCRNLGRVITVVGHQRTGLSFDEAIRSQSPELSRCQGCLRSLALLLRRAAQPGGVSDKVVVMMMGANTVSSHIWALYTVYLTAL